MGSKISQAPEKLILIGLIIGIIATILLSVGVYLFRYRSIQRGSQRFPRGQIDEERGIPIDCAPHNQYQQDQNNAPRWSWSCSSRISLGTNTSDIQLSKQSPPRRWRVVRGRLVSVRSEKNILAEMDDITQFRSKTSSEACDREPI